MYEIMAQQETTVVSKLPHACGDSVVPDKQQDIWKIMLDEILSWEVLLSRNLMRLKENG